jgi:uroporphyrinogen-III synthase
VTRAVLVTRHPADCADLESLLRPAGLTVRPYPVLRLEDADDPAGWRAIRRLLSDPSTRPWLVITSPRAPERLVRQARTLSADALLDWPVAAVGGATAAAAARVGLRPALVGHGSGLGLARELIARLGPHDPVVLACGADRRLELPEALAAAGHPVYPVVVYAMKPTPTRELPPLGPGLAAVVLTSPRAARLYLEAVGGRPLPLPHWALGATTRDAAAALGIDCRAPASPTIESLAEELCRI